MLYGKNPKQHVSAEISAMSTPPDTRAEDFDDSWNSFDIALFIIAEKLDL